MDGDGEYEIVLKWDPSNSKDNSQSGYTGNVFLDAYKLNGTRLWRIDLGKNIRAGAHYTQFIVYDLDGDGRAEISCKTADGTVDGAGQTIGSASADYRNSAGYILSGPEFLTVFDGVTGAALHTMNYSPARGNVSDWGDNYGNRVDRFLAGVAYLDGRRPSLIMARGYYTRTVLVAWDLRGGQLTRRWTFDTRDGTPGNLAYEGQGNHNLSIGDVDNDGRDEIVYGACAIDDDGRGLYTTGLGHGDALHLSDMNPDRPGQEVFQPHESPAQYGANGLEFRDARSGALIWGKSGENSDVGRGVAFDIDPRHLGYEAWASRGALYNARGEEISAAKPSQMNFGVWWDADPLRELLDRTMIDKWNWTTNSTTRMLTATDAASNNSTKATPALSGDVLGDWREEVIFRRSDSSELRIYTTTIPAANRLYTLMHDAQYRLAIAWQNVGYNQPPHPSFYLGDGMSAPPVPNIVAARNSLSAPKNKPSDFDGDGKSDIAVFRPEAGAWYVLRSSNNSFAAINFGVSVDIIAPGDYDGDGRMDVAVFRPENSAWYISPRPGVVRSQQFGTSGDVPVAADYDGDGVTDIAVFRPSNGAWYIANSFDSRNNYFRSEQFGQPGDLAVPGDYDADGRADLAVFRPSNGTWYLNRSTAGFTAAQFGASTDKPAPGDYDGDGKTDIAVYRPSNGAWYLLRSTAGFTAVQFGASTDQPSPADFDGDGKWDLAVFRPENGAWYLLQSQSGFAATQFGALTDRPIAAAYIP